MKSGKSIVATVKKMTDAPQRLLNENAINDIYEHLCKTCKAHCDQFVHLTCGRGG